MDENSIWVNFRDSLLTLYGVEYSQEDILVAFTIIENKFFQVLDELNK